jgi:hypothetical protein
MFLSYVEDRSKYKCKHHQIYIYTQNTFPIVGLLEETRRRGKDEENERE